MFKNIRKKLEQGVAQSKAVVSGLTKGDESSESNTSSDSLGRPTSESTPQKDARQVKPKVGDSIDSQKGRTGTTEPLLDSPDIERSSGIGHEGSAKDSRSRTSSVSSLISDSTHSPGSGLSPIYTALSDVESEVEDPTVNLASLSKEDLQSFVKSLEQRAFKYKSKFLEVTAAYKDVLLEKEQLKAKLLKDRKEHSKELKSEATAHNSDDASKKDSSINEEMELLKSKIKRQDGLLQKCKETITSYKDKMSQLSQEKQELLGKLELMSKGSDKDTPQSPDHVSRLQAQMQEARRVIEQLESDREVAIAEVKHQIHEEMEKKDAELENIKGQYHKCLTENNNLKTELEKLANESEELRKTSQEQLEKARNIMRRLKEDKRLAIEQAEVRIRQAELSMEEEKEKMLIDLKRGKAEAFSVMQQESEKNLASKVEAAVLDRDKFWSKKMAAQEAAHGEMLRVKDREKEMALAAIQEEVRQKLKEKEDEVRLALEERELQKMAAVTGLDEQKDRLLLQIEELSSAKIELGNRFSKFQEDSERKISELKERLKQKETEHTRQILELQSSHDETLKKEISCIVQKTAAEVELLKQRHAEEVQSLIDKQEQELQESNADTENYYKIQLESEKEKLESLLSVTTGQLEDMRSSYMQTQTKLKETENLLLMAKAHLESRTNDQLVFPENVQQSFTDMDDLVQGVQQLSEAECSTETQAVEKEGSPLGQVNQSLPDNLKSMEYAEATSEWKDSILKIEPCMEKPSQSEQDREGSDSIMSQELKERIIELQEENKCLKRNVENSKLQVEELENVLQEALNEKKTVECKSQELEVQVGQLQEVIRTLESCQNTVEKEKSSLEYKLTCLENIVEDLKSSKMELNEKLHGRHEALILQSAEEKQVLESRANQLALEIDILKEELDALNKALLSKNDENMALRSVVDDNTNFIKSLEGKIEKLTADLQVKSQTSSQNEAALVKSQEKFEKLKNEANAKVKGLKDMKDSLTEQLNQKQKEFDEIQQSLKLEQETLVKNYEQKLSKQETEIRTLEQTFKEQFAQKQAKFKERINKLKEHHANILSEKDKNFEDRLKEVVSQKDLGVEDLTVHLEKVKEEQLECLKQKHKAAIDELTAGWEITYKTLKNSQSQELESITCHYQQQVTDLQQQLSDKDSLMQELNCAIASIQKELEDMKLEMIKQSEKHTFETESLNAQLVERSNHIQKLSERYTSEIESLNAQLAERNNHFQKLSENVEQFDKPVSESVEMERLRFEINLLTKQLKEKDNKLETMAGTISAEQEHLHKQLTQQTERAEKLQAEKIVLLNQLTDSVEKYEVQLRDKDVLQQRLNLFEREHATVKEILTDCHDKTGKCASIQSLEECLRLYQYEKDTELHNLKSELDTKIKQLSLLQEEIEYVKISCEQRLVDMTQNHGKELDAIKSHNDYQLSQLSLTNAQLQTEVQALKSQLTEVNEKWQNCIHSYEDRLRDEKLKLETQEVSHKEQINILKQQLQNIQSQTDVSSTKIHSTLVKSRQEGDKKHQDQLQLHQKDIDIVKQEAEQTMKDLRQKYMIKLKEIQCQAKDTIQELENTLHTERSAKSEMYDELTRANTRLLQLEENTGTSRNTIVDLEHKVVEMTNLLKSKDNEISRLKEDMAESEKSMQEILDETEANCRQINDKLTEAEAKLKEEESNQQHVNNELKETLLQLKERETFIEDLGRRLSELQTLYDLEIENKHELQKKSNALMEMEDLFQKAQSCVQEEKEKNVELDNSLKSALSELEQFHAEKLHLEAEMLRLSTEHEELKSKLLDAEIKLENSIVNNAVEVKELESKLSEKESQIQLIEQDNHNKLTQLKLVHAAELSASLDTKHDSEIAEYKRKAKAEICQVKKQLEDEQAVTAKKHQEDFSKLQNTISLLTVEINDLKLSREKLIIENENIVQKMKHQFEQEMKLKQSVIEECDSKQQEHVASELNLKKEIDSLLSERNVLLEKLSVIGREMENLKVQYATGSEELMAKNNELHKSLESLQPDRDQELITLKTELSDLKAELEDTLQKLQKSNDAVQEEQASHCMSRMHVEEQELQISFREKSEENQHRNQDLVQRHQKDIDDLKQEIIDKDRQIDRLRVDYQSHIQSAQDRQIKELQSELQSVKLLHQQEIRALEMRTKVELESSQSSNCVHSQEFSDWTHGYDSDSKDTCEHDETENSLLQQQVVLLTSQIEQLKQQHSLELASAVSKSEAGHKSTPKPFIAAPTRLNMDALDPNFLSEMQNLELVNMDLQAQVSQLYGELNLYKIKEQDLLRKMERMEQGRKSMSDDDDPPLSLDGSFLNHTDSVVFREPTEFEYLKNILYEYMMGRETKTLTKVIATVVRFSDEQMQNVLAKADTKVSRKS